MGRRKLSNLVFYRLRIRIRRHYSDVGCVRDGRGQRRKMGLGSEGDSMREKGQEWAHIARRRQEEPVDRYFMAERCHTLSLIASRWRCYSSEYRYVRVDTTQLACEIYAKYVFLVREGFALDVHGGGWKASRWRLEGFTVEVGLGSALKCRRTRQPWCGLRLGLLLTVNVAAGAQSPATSAGWCIARSGPQAW